MNETPPGYPPLANLHPDQHGALQEMRRQAEETHPELTGPSFARVREIIGDPDAEAFSDDGLDERQLAFVAFSERFAFSVASVSDDDVESLLEHADPVDVYQFIAALYSLEMSARIELVSRTVLAEGETA